AARGRRPGCGPRAPEPQAEPRIAQELRVRRSGAGGGAQGDSGVSPPVHADAAPEPLEPADVCADRERRSKRHVAALVRAQHELRERLAVTAPAEEPRTVPVAGGLEQQARAAGERADDRV